ncbi:hypothetical protein EV207_10941 [Scopulibacillus darangshiensis]|uniref:DUF917 domain-containing protein n=1 Tax=Scopulibacillus darangshiensis TaxID=442528 RepID=A0A4R2P4L1_9BACL|nr:DUF917 domain-containing protein [Scopulibacillus darangshiensis]TCP29587.1 hypothetical protein EV207_10941 [Scopulibacillus darangshiensis]
MRYLGEREIEDIAVGASLLGTGGGGDPHIGKLMALQAIEEQGPVQLLEVDELPDDALIVPIGMMGAPTVLFEKAPGEHEATNAFSMMEDYLGEKVYATMPIEIGGVNSLLPVAVAARLGLPVVNVDGMGRAFPELQMVTFYLDGISASPLILADERGNTSVMNTVDNHWAERLARSATIQMGGSATVAQYPMHGKDVRRSGIAGSLGLAEDIGKAIREAKQNNQNPVDEVILRSGGIKLFEGKVTDISRRTVTGFARGTATIEGINADRSHTLKLHFQNEFLLAEKNDAPVCITPDLICTLDADTGTPITTEGLRYGVRCAVIGIPCHEKWRTNKGLETCGPGYFGYGMDYMPLETPAAKGDKTV